MSMKRLIVAGWIAVSVSVIAATASALDLPAARDSNSYKLNDKQLSGACRLLDDKAKVARMDGLVHKLASLCSRPDLLGGVRAEAAEIAERMERDVGTDVQVSDPTGESGSTQTQSETSIARDENTGVLCSGFNDAYGALSNNEGFTGLARSTDNGQSFDDRGGIDTNSFGDPAMVWRRADGNFYIATLHEGGLGFYGSSDQCQSMTFLGLAHSGGGDDKEFVVVDNNPGSPFYGRIHLVWIDFNASARIYSIFSDDASNWSNPVALSASVASVQGAWPAVGPDGTVYASWLRFGSGNDISIETVRSTDGGGTWTEVANPVTNVQSPTDNNATSFCGRTALKGNLRYLPSPQIVVSSDGVLHTVYTYDPDGDSNGNESDVFYRRSTNQGTSWQAEVLLNDDGTETDQYFPTLSVGQTGRLVVTWYDRRLDANNLLVDYYATTSVDGGATWEPNVRISDESSAIYLDPNLATCYHGDYDQSVQDAASVFVQWSDDRRISSGHADPDVYLERKDFGPDFFLSSTPSTQSLCAPDDAVYDISVGQALNFSDPVTLSTLGEPAGSTTSFSLNPVAPGSSTILTIGTVSAAAGSYMIDVNGSTASLDRSVGVVLELSTAAPGETTLQTPADLTTDVAMPSYSWTGASQATSYTIEVSSNAAFTNIVDSATVEETSYSSDVVLAPQTQYFWRVRAENSCGEGSDSPVFSFTSAARVCNTTSAAIPDNQPSGVNSTSNVASSGLITDLNVSIVATHSYVGDLRFLLTHVPTGTSVTLIDRPGYTDSGFGCSSDNIDATLDDEASLPVEDQCASNPALGGLLIPQEELAAFDGEDFAGEWTLNASDNANGDVGAVEEWCMRTSLMSSAPDTDGDGVTDDVDNCTLVANPTQCDGDGDDYGNHCDADFNNDLITNGLDIGPLKAAFGTADPVTDLNCDGIVNGLDIGPLKAMFGAAPGPSGLVP